MTMPPGFTDLTFVFSAAGFIATSASTSSPGVKISSLEKWTWYPDTPASVPAGARISAGKSGSVEMSLPTRAEVSVNCVPANCMPSPESPANRMVTEGSAWTGLVAAWPLPDFSPDLPLAVGGCGVWPGIDWGGSVTAAAAALAAGSLVVTLMVVKSSWILDRRCWIEAAVRVARGPVQDPPVQNHKSKSKIVSSYA